MSWKELIKDYKFYLQIERGLAENTVKNYTSDIISLANFILSEDIDEQPKNCSKETLQRFIYQQSKSISNTSQARRISSIKSFLIFEKLRTNSPADLIEGPKLGRKLPDILNLMEIEKILLGIELSLPNGHRNRAIIETLYGSGLRVSELVNLTLSNIFFKEDLIKITGKGDKQRLVPLGNYSKKFIQIYMNEIRSLKKITKEHNDYLFLNRNGRKMTRAMIYTIVKESALKVGIKQKISPHTFRHSCATHLLENGADLRSIQLLMGHESITTTEIYTHLDNKQLKRVLEEFHPRNK